MTTVLITLDCLVTQKSYFITASILIPVSGLLGLQVVPLLLLLLMTCQLIEHNVYEAWSGLGLKPKPPHSDIARHKRAGQRASPQGHWSVPRPATSHYQY